MKLSITTQKILDQFGLVIGLGGQTEIVDFYLAGECYVHHSSMPTALAGFTMVSPEFALGRFPKVSFIDFIQKRPAMDEREILAFAAVCGIDVSPPFWSNPEPFAKHLWDVIARHQLDVFFERVEGDSRLGDHYCMRPRGGNWTDPDQPELPNVLSQWRAEFRLLSLTKQLMVATILQLYRQGPDHYWMVRVPKKWHACEGINELKKSDALGDWARLYALYPGW
ncbi:hypothetical protein HA050_12020 [Iodobacter sp. HSC-16F04]|uniref:Uncharacterized protein n=1 Tax=Iodobacter violaceini TaxID=3044271 RepID=A0ABX0KQL4_9NEIS|nr:hypothetical protein [Iodobacter violacea]NHQ86845.1 hypothetical protein [Iodobacter violacea]